MNNLKIQSWEVQVVDLLVEHEEATYDHKLARVLSVLLSVLPSINKMSCRSFCHSFATKGVRTSASDLIDKMNDVKIVLYPADWTEIPLFLLKGEYLISIKDYWRAGKKTYRIA